jgi:hypothetical protein
MWAVEVALESGDAALQGFIFEPFSELEPILTVQVDG